jgi:hypothetical protein
VLSCRAHDVETERHAKLGEQVRRANASGDVNRTQNGHVFILPLLITIILLIAFMSPIVETDQNANALELMISGCRSHGLDDSVIAPRVSGTRRGGR